MGEKLGILVLHGIGEEELEFDTEFNNFKNAVNKNVKDGSVVWKKVFWSKEINEIESRYLKSLDKYKLNYSKLRSFMISAVADETAYRKGINEETNSIYSIIQNHIYNAVKEIYSEMGEEGELFIVSYSMGTTIISDYIWDVQNGKTNFVIDNDFEGMKKIKYLFTMGSTLPLFLFSLSAIAPISIGNKKWINLYSKNDILAYPLAVFKEYENIVVDKEVKVGSILTWWNPASHLGYFKAKDVISLVTEKINE